MQYKSTSSSKRQPCKYWRGQQCSLPAATKETWLWFCSSPSGFAPASVQPLQRKVCQACFSCPGSLRATIRTLSSVDVCVKTAKTCVRIAFDQLGAYGKVSANKRKERQCFVVLKVLRIHLTIGAIVVAGFFFLLLTHRYSLLSFGDLYFCH